MAPVQFVPVSAKTDNGYIKTEIQKTIRNYTHELSLHSVSTGQCKRVCFSGGHFPNTVIAIKRMAPVEGTNWMTMTWNYSRC